MLLFQTQTNTDSRHTIDGPVTRIDRHEKGQAARDSQFEKLLDWARNSV